MRVQTSTPIAPGFRSGDEVIVKGENPPEPPFLAQSVVLATKSGAKPSRQIPWITIAAIAGALSGLFFTQFQGGDLGSWTLQTLDGMTRAPNVLVEVLDDRSRQVKIADTNGIGRVTFQGLAKGSYSAKGPGGSSVSATITGKFHIESTLPVDSPFIYVDGADDEMWQRRRKYSAQCGGGQNR
jgi:hypothetical protein